MEHRGVEYRIIQGIKRGFWKWSIETEIGTKSGTSDSKEAAMAVASDLPVEQPTKFECSAGFRGDSQGASRRPCRVPAPGSILSFTPQPLVLRSLVQLRLALIAKSNGR